MEILRGYNIKNRKGLSHWESLLEEWLLVTERYCRIMGGEDAPFWYNERSNIGLLAGASWRCGRISLEEFQITKGYRNKPKKHGRSDLWMALEDGREELIEAKFKWISLHSKDLSSVVNEALDRAMNDAKKARGNDEDTKAIGIGFFPVYVTKNKVHEIDSIISSMINQFLELEYHSLAWSFPEEIRQHISSKDNVVPGVFMVARNIDY